MLNIFSFDKLYNNAEGTFSDGFALNLLRLKEKYDHEEVHQRDFFAFMHPSGLSRDITDSGAGRIVLSAHN